MGTIPQPGHCEDDFLMCLICRAILDAFWGRETNTVLANHRNLDQMINIWSTLMLRSPMLPPIGPFPTTDVFGVTVALTVLAKSLEPGHYKDKSQLEMMRKFRATFSNLYHISPEGANLRVALALNTSKTYLSSCPTHSLWFKCFSKGCLLWMGQVVKQHLAISI